MYSNSNSYLGANNVPRPGSQHQYGTPFGQQAPQQLGPQPTGFVPQQTGYGQAPLSQQYTGFPGGQGMPGQPQGLQPQYTGFPGQAPQQQSFQTGAPPVPQIPQQFQQQYNQQQQQQQQASQNSFLSPSNPPPSTTTAAPSVKPQPTGFTAMAASFRTGGTTDAQPAAAAKPQKTSNKIPNIRLSFITAQDQAKFETLFKSAVGESNTTMSGDKARDLLLRSRLDGDSLSHIWYVVEFPFQAHKLMYTPQDAI